MSSDFEIPDELKIILDRIAHSIDETETLNIKVLVKPDQWTVQIFLAVQNGSHRFDEVQREVGLSRNLLTDRLRLMEKLGILRRVQYSEKPKRYEYVINRDGDGPSGQPAMVLS